MSAVVDFPVKPEARPYLDAFVETVGEPQWLRDSRRHGMARFAELGFPGRKSEGWRYLDLHPLARQPLLPAAARVLATVALEPGLAGAAARIVVIDGTCRLGESVSLPAGVWVGSVRQALAERPDLVRVMATGDGSAGDPFALLNVALFSDGFILDVAPGVVLDAPLEVVHFSAGGGAAHTRSLINLGAGSRVRLVETFAGGGRYWRNDVVAARLAESAAFERTVVVEETGEAVHLGRFDAMLGADARLDGVVMMLGGLRARQEWNVRLAGEGARCRIDGAFVVASDEEANIVTAIDHAAPGGETRELVKGVAAGRGHGAFQGRIIVREHAQKSDAHQLSRNLLLGRRAVIDTKPELEILADDVKCSHGASVGDLDETALFYLRARGIAADEARRMLIEGFLSEAVADVADAALREHLLWRLAARLGRLEE